MIAGTISKFDAASRRKAAHRGARPRDQLPHNGEGRRNAPAGPASPPVGPVAAARPKLCQADTVASADELETLRPRLFGLAYRLLGSAADAEDAVQDAYVRWRGADHTASASPPAWLAKVTANLCLNHLATARVRRTAYVGPWLPEPVLSENLGPLDTAEQRDSVSLAVLVLMERLTPVERAVFVLREAFGYGHREIAEILETTESNSRQLHRRARHRVNDVRPRFRPDRDQWRRLVEQFLGAAQRGDLPALERLLAADVTSWADGGGKVGAARRPVSGRERVARYVTGLVARGPAVGADVSFADVNGEPAILTWKDEQLIGILVPEIDDGLIAALRLIVNPDKLRFVAGRAESPSHRPGLSGSHG